MCKLMENYIVRQLKYSVFDGSGNDSSYKLKFNFDGINMQGNYCTYDTLRL